MCKTLGLETLSNIASSHARLGDIQAELGRREEALASFRAAVSVREEVIHRFPNNVHARHQLMLAYSHVGDMLGNPAYDNFGDEQGARIAYGKMVEVARSLHETDPADVRALSDYGIALLRVGIVSAPQRKRATLEQGHGLLERAAIRNPKDMPTRRHKAWTEVELGDVLLVAGDHASASRYYRMAIATCEQLIDPADSISLRWLVTAARKLAEEQARSRDRAGAVSTLNKTLQLADRVNAQAPVAGVTIRSVLARAWQAAGSVHAMLAERERGEQRERDLEAARGWYRRSIAEWRKLEPLRGFTRARKKEMASTEAEMTALHAPAGRSR